MNKLSPIMITGERFKALLDLNSFLTVLWVSSLCGAFIVRAIHLNYNSPFNDEAVYVVVGKMGIFLRDWWSYNAQSWMAGLPYLYPSASALAYETGGIVGSRLLNVFFGVLSIAEIYEITFTINLIPNRKKLASLIAAIIVGFSSTGIYLSRLATYDMPSFFLFFLSVNYLLKASDAENGKYYFIAAVSGLLALYTKIIVGVLLPIVIIFSYMRVAKGSFARKLWWRYFLVPMVIGLLLFAVINLQGFLNYSHSQVNREFISLSRILGVIWENAAIIILLAVPSFFLLYFTRQARMVSFFLLLACAVPILHIITHRLSTLDKHTFLLVAFLAPVIGYGVSSVFNVITDSRMKLRYAAFICIGVVLYGYTEINYSKRFERQWRNGYAMQENLKKLVTPDSKILVAEGAASILALFPHLMPTDVATLDWFEYQGYAGDAAYTQAIEDGYFTVIELDDQAESKEVLSAKVRSALVENYDKIYEENSFEIYARSF
jgi:hypothetical protein